MRRRRLVDEAVRQPEPAGRVVEIADGRSDEHRADVRGQRQPERGEARADPRPDPHRDENCDHVLEQASASGDLVFSSAGPMLPSVDSVDGSPSRVIAAAPVAALAALLQA